MMNLSNVMCAVAQVSSPLVSNSFSSPSLNPLSFVPKPSLRPPKLVLYHAVDPSSISYHTAASSSHSSVVAVKMVAIYAAKGRGVSINVHQHFSSTSTSKGKHIRFTYSSDEDKDEEGLGHGPCPGDVPVEDAIVTRSPVGSDDSSQSEKF
ncbi:hypothetical protein DVH24_027480 [Malus domestica]|uniref:Uncharacterized protein n=1 Tax=Malus domestica TaxID=3750 RepID=A0A498H960_MALDO|nr:hypothetical protein DVH24_027480 [Malus domestica]